MGLRPLLLLLLLSVLLSLEIVIDENRDYCFNFPMKEK